MLSKINLTYVTAPSNSDEMGVLTNSSNATPLHPGSTFTDRFSKAINSKIDS